MNPPEYNYPTQKLKDHVDTFESVIHTVSKKIPSLKMEIFFKSEEEYKKVENKIQGYVKDNSECSL